jgi:hypothetical protein
MDSFKIFKFNSIYDEPKFIIRKGKQWIEFGHDNNAPAYISSLLEMSPTHAAIINGIIDMAYGEGLVVPTDAKAKAFYDNVEGEENLDALVRKLIVDIYVFGALLINPRWRKDKNGIASLHHTDIEKMRLDNNKKDFWICDDWVNWRRSNPKFYSAFDGKEKGGSQLMYVKMPHARKTPYALPSYWSVREYIEADQELITFHLNRQRNGFFPSTIIVLEGNPTPEEMEKFEGSLTKFFAGSMNSGKAALVNANGVKFEKFEASDVPQDFELLQTTVDRKIRVGHRISGNGQIFGLGPAEGMHFSSKDDLRTEYALFDKTVIRPIQKVIVDALNRLSAANGITHQWEIKPFEITLPEEIEAKPDKKEAKPDEPQLNKAA